MGFDEVQFDYVRFPDNRGVAFSQPATEESRSRAITQFLETAYRSLRPYNIFVAADVFGYVPWNTNDTTALGTGMVLSSQARAILKDQSIVHPMPLRDALIKAGTPMIHADREEV